MGGRRQPPAQPKEVPAPTNDRRDYLRGDYEWGVPPGTYAPPTPAYVASYHNATAGVNTTDTATGVSTGIAFAVTAGKRYMLRGRFSSTSAAAADAPRFRLVVSGGASLPFVSLAVLQHLTGTTLQGSSATASGTNTSGTTGPGATTLPLLLDGLARCTAPGTATLNLVSDAGGTVTIVEGSLEVVEF